MSGFIVQQGFIVREDEGGGGNNGGYLLPANVLMVGNSYTKDFGGVPSLETIIEAIAAQDGFGDLTVTTRAVDGYDFEDHQNDATTTTAINSQQWTHVVLQGLSTEAAYVPSRTSFLTNGELLAAKVINNRANTRILLFETPAYAAGHSAYPATFADPDTMMAGTVEGYLLLRTEILDNTSANYAEIVKCGTLIQLAGGNKESSDPLYRELHQADDSHENNDRQILEACQFYTKITGRNATPFIEAALTSISLVSTLGGEDLATWAFNYEKTGASPPVPVIPGEGFELKLDFGNIPDSLSATEDGWTAITQTLGSYPLEGADGLPSGANLVLTAIGNNWNILGAASGSGFTPPIPNNASYDAWFGDNSNPTMSFYIENLPVGAEYTVNFYSSRAGVAADGRYTQIQIVGESTVSGEIESAGNTTNVLSLSAIVASNGRLTFNIQKGASNVHASGFFYNNAITLIPLASVNPVMPTNDPKAIGDSFTDGTGASPSSNSYVNRIGAATGWTMSVYAYPGTQISASATAASNLPTVAGDLTTLLAGYNDMRLNGGDTIGLDSYEATVRGIVAWKLLPTAAKALGSVMTASNFWTDGTFYGVAGRYSDVNGAKLTFTASGTAIYVGWLNRRGLNDGGIFTIKVDGVLKATVDTNYALATQGAEGSYWPAGTRVGGLSAGSHTVELEVVGSGKFVNIQWGGGSDGALPNIWFVLGTVPRMQAAAYGMYDPYDNGSDAAVAAFNARLTSIYTDFRGDGFDIRLAGVSAAFDPINCVPDLVHPNNAGHQQIADAFLASMGY